MIKPCLNPQDARLNLMNARGARRSLMDVSDHKVIKPLTQFDGILRLTNEPPMALSRQRTSKIIAKTFFCRRQFFGVTHTLPSSNKHAYSRCIANLILCHTITKADTSFHNFIPTQNFASKHSIPHEILIHHTDFDFTRAYLKKQVIAPIR